MDKDVKKYTEPQDISFIKSPNLGIFSGVTAINSEIKSISLRTYLLN